MSTSDYMSRPARLQVDVDQIPDDDKPPQTGHTFNIWYLKWAGGDSNTRNVVQSKFRVNIEQDSGTTRGTDGKSPICLFFARGCCYKGKDCPYLHRPPRPSDVRVPTQDCFGRDKTTEYKDDMSGVGSLSRVNMSLYVGGIHMNDQIQDTLSEQFSEFGEIDKIKVLPSKGCAFVSFRTEPQAQFAKEAMDAQTLDGKDVLTVRWANDDPDPNAQEAAKRSVEQMAMDTVKNLLGNIEEPTPSKRQKPNKSSKVKEKEKSDESEAQPESSTEAAESPVEQNDGIFDASRLEALQQISQERKTAALRHGSEPKKDATFLSGYSSDEESD